MTRVAEPPEGGRIRRARIVKVDETGESPGQSYSKRTRKTFNDKGQLVLKMKLNETARKALADTGKVFAQLETTIGGRDGTRNKHV